MSDPAVEAAQRAWRKKLVVSEPIPEAVKPPMGFVDAAREALAPLRAKHQRRARQYGPDVCTSCRDAYGDHADWPTGTDRLIYPSEEL
jgi:hypothetical protein